MKAVIIAAGQGNRLRENTRGTPKTLLPFDNGTILSKIIQHLSLAGIRDLTIVIGFQKQQIIDYVRSQNNFGLNITLAENPEWEKGNGISVLAARASVDNGPFILSMSDHIVSVHALKKIAKQGDDKNMLLVDPNIHDCFDIDDATKVETRGKSIVHIGKEIEPYNGLDCGIFRLTPRFFTAMTDALKNGQDSISAAINQLIKNRDMEATLISPDDFWIDIDTSEAYHHALKHVHRTEK